MALPFDRPPALIILQNCNLRIDRGAGQHRCSLIKLGADLFRFLVDRNRGSVGPNQDSVILLDCISAVTDIVPGHGPHFALIEDVVVTGPVHPAWLSLHHPEVSPQKAAREVMGSSCGYRVEMT